jgi:hypothetical protein
VGVQGIAAECFLREVLVCDFLLGVKCLAVGQFEFDCGVSDDGGRGAVYLKRFVGPLLQCVDSGLAKQWRSAQDLGGGDPAGRIDGQANNDIALNMGRLGDGGIYPWNALNLMGGCGSGVDGWGRREVS